MGAYVGDSDWMHGPLVLGRRKVKDWASLRAKATAILEPHHQAWDPAAATVEIEGEQLLVLPQGMPTAWHAAPFGGYLVRMISLAKPFSEKRVADVRPTEIRPEQWQETGVRFAVGGDGELALVDFGLKLDAAQGEAVAIKLAAGSYAVDVVSTVEQRGNELRIVRLRAAAVTPAEAALDAGASAKAKREPAWPVDAAAKEATKATKLVESEGGPYLVLGTDALAGWTGVDGEDYDRTDSVGSDPGVIRVGKTSAILLGTPDPVRLVPHGEEVLVVRQLGADKPLHAVAAALAIAASAKTTWKKTKTSLVVGEDKRLWVVDAAEAGEALLKKARLPAQAGFVEAAPGSYELDSAGEVNGLVVDGKKESEVMLIVHRLRRA